MTRPRRSLTSWALFVSRQRGARRIHVCSTARMGALASAASPACWSGHEGCRLLRLSADRAPRHGSGGGVVPSRESGSAGWRSRPTSGPAASRRPPTRGSRGAVGEQADHGVQVGQAVAECHGRAHQRELDGGVFEHGSAVVVNEGMVGMGQRPGILEVPGGIRIVARHGRDSSCVGGLAPLRAELGGSRGWGRLARCMSSRLIVRAASSSSAVRRKSSRVSKSC